MNLRMDTRLKRRLAGLGQRQTAGLACGVCVVMVDTATDASIPVSSIADHYHTPSPSPSGQRGVLYIALPGFLLRGAGNRSRKTGSLWHPSQKGGDGSDTKEAQGAGPCHIRHQLSCPSKHPLQRLLCAARLRRAARPSVNKPSRAALSGQGPLPLPVAVLCKGPPSVRQAIWRIASLPTRNVAVTDHPHSLTTQPMLRTAFNTPHSTCCRGDFAFISRPKKDSTCSTKS